MIIRSHVQVNHTYKSPWAYTLQDEGILHHHEMKGCSQNCPGSINAFMKHFRCKLLCIFDKLTLEVFFSKTKSLLIK